MSDVIPSRKRPVVTIALIAVSALALVHGGGLDAAPATAEPGVTALLTSVFVHAGWLPAAASLLCLWIFGDNVEGAMGRPAFLLFYVTTGALGALAQAAASPGVLPPVSAASGPIAAVLSAYFVLYPRSQVLMVVFLILYVDVFEIPATFLLGFWVLLQLITGVAAVGAGVTSGAAFAPLLVGLAVGAVAGLGLKRRVRWE